MKRFYLAILFTLSLLFTGCFTRDMTRYTADGKPYAKDRITAFMVRGEVTQLKEEVSETHGGDYKRKVSLGALKGETETDKIAELVKAAVQGAVSGAANAVVPVPVK